MAEKSILIFGAGKIGRSFIGQLFGRAGYHIIFVDMDHSLVRELNIRGTYPVIIKGPDSEERMMIENVRAIHALERNAIIQAISRVSIMAISVGKNALPTIAPIVAETLLIREKDGPGRKLDIILAENMRSADLFFRDRLRENLPPTYPLDDQIGLVETSIGKMVPIMTASELEKDPLQVFAEPYNTLILDKKGFRGDIPFIKELALKENMKAWVDRKAFIHNLGHATAAYYGYLKIPQAIFMYEVLAHKEVYGFTKRVMQEAAQILRAVYPDEFTMESLSAHIEDLLTRFQNRNLRDTLFRVGSDLHRKLGRDDRFMGIIRMAVRTHLPYDMILEAMTMGFLFRAGNEQGTMLPQDIEFHSACNKNPDQMLKDVCGLNDSIYGTVMEQLKQNLNTLRSEHTLQQGHSS